jgi:hypothetical protein
MRHEVLSFGVDGARLRIRTGEAMMQLPHVNSSTVWSLCSFLSLLLAVVVFIAFAEGADRR